MKKVLLTILCAASSGFLSAQTQEPFPNGGFESWESYSATNPSVHPSQFYSLNEFSAVTLGIVTCGKGTPPNVNSGNFSARLKSAASVLSPSGVIPAMITTGTINVTNFLIEGGMPFTSRPDSIVAWIKYAPALNASNITDTGYVEILLLNNDATDTVGRGRINVFEQIGAFTRFSAPILYFNSNTPVKLRAILNASSGYSPVANSEIFIDDAEFIYNPTSVSEVNSIAFKVFPNPTNEKLYVEYDEKEPATIVFYNLDGKVVVRKSVERGLLELDINTLPVGNYLYSLKTFSGKSFTGKVSVQ